jgi:Carboxypeptidase regulatory-like domain/TonB-dependent Receptor Plug Domain
MVNKARRPGLGAALALILGMAPGAAAQSVTTGGLTGRVVDESGGAVPGATVEAVHEPTGTRYTTVSGNEGVFSLLNIRAGSPYSVTATLSGFKPEKVGPIAVVLGGQTAVDFRLKVETVSETVDVVAEGASLFTPSANGPAANVSEDAIETLPTVARGIEDFARLSPYFNSQGSGDGSGANALSVAGRNTRYNNIQIDGAVNNDLFGLADSGTPGGQTESQPVSIDAVQELQLVVAPYDVRQGGFSGGGVNAITRSGTNEFHGTAYYFFRSESLVGDGPGSEPQGLPAVEGKPIATFDDKQYGASLGGPIVKDKAFFFANVEFGRKDRPSGWSIDGSSGQTFGFEAQAQRFLSILNTKYGYDPGGTSEFIRDTPSDKVLAKLDFNLSDRHRLTLRHNYIKASNDIGFPTSTNYFFPDFFYKFRDTTNSSVAQLNSTFGGGAVNEFRVTYQWIRDNRDGPTEFPTVFVDVLGIPGPQFRAGRENFSTANALDQDVLEVTDDFTFMKGNHTITVGTHNEFFEFKNLFIRDNFGNYRFSSLDNLDAGLAQSFDYSFSLTGNAQQAAQFKVNQFGFYAGDLWRITPTFTLNYGVRLDIPSFPDKPTANPAAVQNFGYATDVVPSPKMWSPRAGFNWNMDGEGKSQLRGGLGLFTGRTPYVWLSNQFGNTGIEFRRVGASFNAINRIPFVADPFNQPTVVTGAIAGSFTNEIDVIDPDYKYPEVLRGNLAYDRDLGIWGLVSTVEFFYSTNIKDIDYQNLNLAQTGTRPDGRPTYTRPNRTFSDVILLTNTDDGHQWSATAKLERPFRNGLYVLAAYNYGDARSVNDGTSSQAASNWGNAYTQGNPNDVGLGRSRFSPGHRIILAASYDIKLGSRANLMLSAFYNGQQGRSYAFTYNGDWNTDGRFTNDLIYVPAANDPRVVFINGTAADWEAYVANDAGLQEFRGRIMEKGASRSPWTNQLDVRAALGIPISRMKFEITFDMLNFLNLLSNDWGVVDNATFGDLNPIPAPTVNDAGQMVYNLANITRAGYVKFDRDDLRSRWQGQVGLRVRF